MDQSLEEEAKKAEAEREAEGGEDDHDNRKMKKADRMRLVLKNKEEGNELFGGGNFKVRRVACRDFDFVFSGCLPTYPVLTRIPTYTNTRLAHSPRPRATSRR